MELNLHHLGQANQALEGMAEEQEDKVTNLKSGECLDSSKSELPPEVCKEEEKQSNHHRRVEVKPQVEEATRLVHSPAGMAGRWELPLAAR